MKLLRDGIRGAEENMRLDAALLGAIGGESEVSVRFYEWKRPSITYGHFVRPEDYLDMTQVEAFGIDLAKRPTGGGLVFHMWDMAFSVLVPKAYMRSTMENYFLINESVRRSVDEFMGMNGLLLIPEDMEAFDGACARFCMARPTKYDVVLHGKKIAGAAQRKTKEGFLHQGTIALQLPDSALLDAILLPGTRIKEAMYASTYPLLENVRMTKIQVQLALEQLFCSYLQQSLSLV